jgi:hypothetical protein
MNMTGYKKIFTYTNKAIGCILEEGDILVAEDDCECDFKGLVAKVFKVKYDSCVKDNFKILDLEILENNLNHTHKPVGTIWDISYMRNRVHPEVSVYRRIKSWKEIMEG